MPRRPRGGEDFPTPLEDGIRRLALGPGPSARRLLHDDSKEVQEIMRAAQPPQHWSLDDRAAVVLDVIREAIDEMTNPRWRNAAHAAFRMPFDRYRGINSVAGRWKELARLEGARGRQLRSSIERYRGYWTIAAHHLAEDVDRRFRLLNNSVDGWRTRAPTRPPTPRIEFPILFDRSDITFNFDAFRCVQSFSQHWATAQGDADHYEPIAWYASQPDAPVEIIPFTNCELDGPLRDLPMGGRCGTLRFARTLRAGDRYYFSYTTRFNSDLRSRPAILEKVRTLGVGSLTIHAQFDVLAMPARCWHFQGDGSRIPTDDDAPELLDIASNGYVEHTFTTCGHGREYGIQWIWPQVD